MALPVFQRTIVTEAGDVIAGAEVEVVLESTGLAADIFSNRDGSTPLTNPFFTGADGFAKFFAAPDEYRITATGPTGSIVFRFVVLTGDSARRDVGTGATQVPTNADLGTMSTQDANAVAITGGSANLAENGLTVGTNQIVTTGGNVGIGTTSPAGRLDVSSSTFNTLVLRRTEPGASSVLFRDTNNNGGIVQSTGAGNISILTTIDNEDTERMRITNAGRVGIGTSSPLQQLHITGNLRIGSSVLETPVGNAPAYLCRAWVNFNGTGTVAIRASGNVSSITDNATGRYTVNFATPMADANYSFSVNHAVEAQVVNFNNSQGSFTNQNAAALPVRVQNSSTAADVDVPHVLVAIFR